MNLLDRPLIYSTGRRGTHNRQVHLLQLTLRCSIGGYKPASAAITDVPDCLVPSCCGYKFPIRPERRPINCNSGRSHVTSQTRYESLPTSGAHSGGEHGQGDDAFGEFGG